MTDPESNMINQWPPMQIQPIGFVRSEIKKPMSTPDDSDSDPQERMKMVRENYRKVKKLVSALFIFPRWEELLDGIEPFSHIMVIYWPHLIDPERRKIKKVHPMGRKDIPEQGIFATCSPARPNPVLTSTVPLLERSKNILKVKGLDAVDESPIIDIKPFVKLSHGAENLTVPSWMEQLHRELTT